MTMTAVAGRDLARCALVVECDCGLCAPTWARRRGTSRRFTEPVMLMMAIEAEPSAARRVEMVQEHRLCLGELLAATDELLALTTIDDPARPSVGSSTNSRARSAAASSPLNITNANGDVQLGRVSGQDDRDGGAGRRDGLDAEQRAGAVAPALWWAMGRRWRGARPRR